MSLGGHVPLSGTLAWHGAPNPFTLQRQSAFPRDWLPMFGGRNEERKKNTQQDQLNMDVKAVMSRKEKEKKHTVFCRGTTEAELSIFSLRNLNVSFL